VTPKGKTRGHNTLRAQYLENRRDLLFNRYRQLAVILRSAILATLRQLARLLVLYYRHIEACVLLDF